MLGHLVVYVFGYVVRDWRCEDHNCPPQLTGQKGWTTDVGGWAFGENARDRYCSINSSGVRKFSSFRAAAQAIEFQERKRRKGERYQLVYRVRNQEHEISDESEIARIDAALLAEDKERERVLAEQRALIDQEYPERERLQELHPMSLAMQLSAFLGLVRKTSFGEAVSVLGLAKSTGYRYRKLLKDAGLLR